MVDVPAGDALALDINGTPLMQMMVFGANGRLLEEQGPLRAVRIAGQADSPLQVLITNQGVSSSRFAFSVVQTCLSIHSKTCILNNSFIGPLAIILLNIF